MTTATNYGISATQYPRSARRLSALRATGRRMVYGDRVFARLTVDGMHVAEYVFDRVSDMTELIGELRSVASHLRGLVKLYVRNISRGWSVERPLMLYGPVCPPVRTAAPRASAESPRPAGAGRTCGCDFSAYMG